MNLKRESKAYSYKDQVEELQLRRELEEKKRKEGKIKQPQYTPKQLEAIKNQKIKEQAIRNKLIEVGHFYFKFKSNIIIQMAFKAKIAPSVACIANINNIFLANQPNFFFNIGIKLSKKFRN